MQFLKLCLYCFLLYFFFAHFTPFIMQFFPNWQAYYEKADELGIETGALFYTDVHVVSDAERATRKATIKAYGDELSFTPVEKEEEKKKKKDKKKILEQE